MQTCFDCDHFIAKVPTRELKNGDKKFLWSKATATCRKGCMQNDKGQIRVFKKLLCRTADKKKQIYNMANRCPYYESE